MKRSFLKYILYFLEAVFAFALQATPYLLPEIFGEKAAALLPLAVSVSLLEEESNAVIFGAFCGLLADFAFSGSVGYFAISFTIICFILSVLSGYIKISFLSELAAGCIAVLLILLLYFVLYFAFSGYNGIMQFFLTHYITRILYTLAFMPLFLLINKKLSGRK